MLCLVTINSCDEYYHVKPDKTSPPNTEYCKHNIHGGAGEPHQQLQLSAAAPAQPQGLIPDCIWSGHRLALLSRMRLWGGSGLAEVPQDLLGAGCQVPAVLLPGDTLLTGRRVTCTIQLSLDCWLTVQQQQAQE